VDARTDDDPVIAECGDVDTTTRISAPALPPEKPAIALDREIPRDRRFQNDDDEQKLLDAADPHLRAVIVALLDTACRFGEGNSTR
jgi:hypothetical protein